ncbi:bacterio-opsin activator domain-containing protein [Natrinema longum]|uniref:Helix-turn-helix domain-containing protein n=1 Tax=Natrinema longum TaxID=370324 RepID=A0A8A2U8D8_9EURY|nr:bacterio-opsin activator domain-containing protein [Natrinema longum]MBZ6494023.1 helix-turn-helix domain-containing protein [Natrinema longum]QSW84642.1 helix-turn-helix domain-containing protein [Natrinema longum]
MTDVHRSKPIVVVTGRREEESDLRTRLDDAIDRDVRTVSTAGGLEDAVDPVSDGESVPKTPSAVVLEIDCPGEIRAVLQRVHARWPEIPTIVAPREGSERLATVALRADATEYVPTEREENPVDRIVSTVRSIPEPPSDGDRGRHSRILANELPDEAFVIGEDGTYLEAKVRPNSANLYSMDADELPGTTVADAFPDQVAAKLQDCVDRAIRTDDVQSVEYDTETTDGRRRFEARVVPIGQRVQGRRAVVWLARDITERVRRERQLRSRQDQLETLNRINAVVRQVIETLVEAPARDAIESEVCAQLVDSELYCGSWIAERTGDGRLSYRTGAGEAERYLERVRGRSSDHERPVTKAARTGEIRTTNRILEDETLPEPLREAADEDDVRSAIAVPITHEDATYGVLTVLASRADAFSERERAGFRLLGETIGFTIMAVKNRQLLFADTVVELEFRIDGGDTFSFDLSEEYGCTCSLEWAGTTANGRTFQYVTIDGIGSETVLEAARDHDSIEECRLIHDGERRCTLEVRLTRSGVRTLANHGATIRDVTVECGVGTCLVEVSQDADVREIAEALTVVYENTELVAKREVDRPVRTAAERRNRILDELTDRQLTTLRLAYYGGFFDWPRESTGEEIAEAMDISPPTMHQHLRKGLRAILEEFFEDSRHN